MSSPPSPQSCLTLTAAAFLLQCGPRPKESAAHAQLPRVASRRITMAGRHSLHAVVLFAVILHAIAISQTCCRRKTA